MRCQYCNRDIDANASFCKFCGKSISTKKEETSNALNVRCAKCGYLNSRHSKYCTKCASDLLAIGSNSINTTREKTNEASDKGIITGGILVVFFVVIIISTVIFSPKQNVFLHIRNTIVQKTHSEDKKEGREEREENHVEGAAEDESVVNVLTEEVAGNADTLYKPVLDTYLKAIENEKFDSELINEFAARYYYYEGNAKIGYAYYDINEDQTPELLMGIEREDNYEVCDIFTYDGEQVVNVVRWAAFPNNLLEIDESYTTILKVHLYPDGYICLDDDSSVVVGVISKEDSLFSTLEADPEQFFERDYQEIKADCLMWKDLCSKKEGKTLSETQLKNILSDSIKQGSVSMWKCEDYNHDGKYEAFACTYDEASDYNAAFYISSIGMIRELELGVRGYFEDILEEMNRDYITWIDASESTNRMKIWTVGEDGMLRKSNLDIPFERFEYDSEEDMYFGTYDGMTFLYGYDRDNDLFIDA